ncbi:MAG: tetratricopeptide repeat protein [Methylophilaceae bacterium]|nr:tetratricopeptide repeat protein [Methylophilaceae bacterium]
MSKNHPHQAANQTAVVDPKTEAEEALHKAFLLHQQGQLAQAQSLYEQVLLAEPNHFDALHLAGIAASQCGQLQVAIDLISKAISVNPNNATAYANLGLALQNLHRYEEALANYDLSLLIDPENAFVFYNLGNILYTLERYAEAVISYERALQIDPDYVAALNNYGVVLHQIRRFDEALASYQQALHIASDNTGALYNRANTLNALSRPEEALASFDQVLLLLPDNAEVLNNRGNTLRALNRLEEAQASLNRAISVAPDYADAHWNLSLCKLLAGDLDAAWQEYEWRWRSELQNDKRQFIQPLWLGEESLHNKTILLHAEQGFGDTLQFCRYVALVQTLGANVLLEVQPELKRLLKGGLGEIATVYAKGEAMPEFDFQCPLMSLPLAFRTNLTSIPAKNAYLFSNKQRVAIWQKKLGTRTRPRVGVVWSGRVEHKNDSNRSIPLNEFAQLVNGKADFFALQKEIQPADKLLLKEHDGLIRHHFKIEDFADTAALIEFMDIVITVDTAVAHLAAAMGKTVWILLPFSPDWRWLLEREDSPWYASVRLFRQPAIGDWRDVIERVDIALQSFF